MALDKGSHLGPYEIVGLIGSGGMGEVYRTRDTRLGRDVAVKVLPAEFADHPERVQRFEQEARAVAALNHPNILSIYDIGEHDGAPYFVTELLEGESLRALLRAGPLPPARAVDYGVQIANGLAAAHEKTIVHRDLKPENLFVTKDGHIKILDFGLARLRRKEPPVAKQRSEAPTVDSSTREGAILGTPGYMAPEQLRGLPVDPRTDIFAFGGVLYEMVSGQKAFSGDSLADLASAILHEDPPDLSNCAPRTPPALVHLVRRCLEKRPEERFSSARDLAFALEAVSGSQVPVLRGRGWLRSRRVGRWVAGAAAGVAMVVAGGAFWFWEGSHKRPVAAHTSHVIKAIAIYPLDDLSGDPSQAYFAPAMTDALNTRLTQIGSLKVIGQASSEKCKQEKMPLPKVADVLGVDAVVEGSVIRVGNRVRISVRLLDARSDSNLWAESYERQMSDVLVLQGEVAQAIATSVRAVVTFDEKMRLAGRPIVPAAFEAYTKASYLSRQVYGEHFGEVPKLLQIAIDKEPSWAPPYAVLAWYWDRAVRFGHVAPKEAVPKIQAAANTALSLVELEPEVCEEVADLGPPAVQHQLVFSE